jgi:carboxypeptidase Taq
MKYETVSQALQQLVKLNKTYMAYVHAMGVMELDAATAAPSGSWEGRGATAGVLSELMYNLIADPDNGELIICLKEHLDELDPVQQRQVEVLEKNYLQMNRIPAEEYVEFNVLCNDAQANWEKAKKSSDFSVFKPYLEKIVAFQ